MEPEGAKDDLLGHLLLLVVVEEVNVGLVFLSLEDFDYYGFDLGECTDDAAHVGDYEGVDEALKLHGA